MSDDLYRGRHRAPAGRHRAVAAPRPTRSRTPRSSLPKLSRPGFLLPTAAAATLALTATGAHLGGSLSAAGLGQAAAQNVTAGITTGILPSAGATGDAVERLEQDRTSRGAARSAGSSTTGGATDALPDGVSADAASTVAPEAAAKAQADAEAKATADAKSAADAQAAATAQAAADAKAAAHAWVAPIGHDSGFQMTSGFGMRWGAMHPGQDFAVAVGTPVRALSSGTVLFAGWEGGYGNKLEIQYWDGTVSWFAHNSKLLV
ncbi:MAG: M23 family metallopeptidase, partial [Lapillicoccus sp.]